MNLLEKARYGISDHDDRDKYEYPIAFDRIHLSNIP
jgi:hypothetical protein